MINRHSDSIIDFELRHGTMEDVFLSLTENRGAP